MALLLSYGQSWYDDGYVITKFFTQEEFAELLDGITNTIKKLVADETKSDVSKFTLENYQLTDF